MHLTATHINYYMICHRKLWLFTNGIHMEHTSSTVYDGKLLHESSYPQRANKYSEIELSVQWNGILLKGQVDFYNAKEKVIHETKRGKTMESAHEWQLRFYIWLFALNDIKGVLGYIEYPKLRKTAEVFLTKPDVEFLEETVPKVQQLVQQEKCPATINTRICKKCSYYELCYIDEL
ncbi:MAG: CRISPR-associated protein Cas4 [Cellulophaga sp.]